VIHPRTANRRDKNERAIIESLRAAGAVCLQMQPGQGFDLLVLWRGVAHVVEVKNPETSTQLTPNEQAFRDECGRVGVPYWVVMDEAGALDIGLF